MKIKFFKSSGEFRQWLDENHDKATELWVGFHKKNSGKASITYAESLDEALCFGWIDGVRKSIDESSYTIRFSRRKPKSNWSMINTKRAKELEKLGRMKASGRKAFQARDPKRSGIYSFENAPRKLGAVYEGKLKANQKAWQFFKLQPPGYQRTVSFWVMSAKKEETRMRRLARLIGDSAKGRRLGIVSGTSEKLQ